MSAAENAEGRVLREGVLSLVERTITGLSDVDKILASFRPPELDPGDYTWTLDCDGAEPSSGAVTVADADLAARWGWLDIAVDWSEVWPIAFVIIGALMVLASLIPSGDEGLDY